MNQLDLVVPGLCGPLPGLDAIQINPALLSLARLFARADKFQSEKKGFYPELAALFGLQPGLPVPSAALCLLGYKQKLGDGYWFHADPVNLQADMDHAVLRDSSSLDLRPEEAAALVEEVNKHFSEDGIRVIAADENHWFINIKTHSGIETTALHDVIGCNINFYLPSGEDKKFWQKFLNEVQMLFHMSDVNQKREKLGLLPINSLWLWGGGELPEVSAPFKQDVYANHVLAKGLAILHDVKYCPVNGVESLFDMINENTPSLVVLDDVFTLACYGDVPAWQKALDTLFEQWIGPLVSHCMSRKVSVRLHPCNGVNYLISPSNKYRFFRKGDIRDHISTYEK